MAKNTDHGNRMLIEAIMTLRQKLLNEASALHEKVRGLEIAIQVLQNDSEQP